MSRDTQISKFMSLVLRHAPHEAELTLDANGWTDLYTLAKVIQGKFGADGEELQRIVDENPKKRFAIEGNRIRAVQGHSLEVDLALKPITPPGILFHGTKRDFMSSILAEGLTRQSRQHVHLSKDIETARIVAVRRKGENVILQIDAAAMQQAGHSFYLSNNGVWLTESVAPKFISILSETDAP